MPWLTAEHAFIVMELVPARRFGPDRTRRPTVPRLATAIVAQVADALAYAHAQGSCTAISSRKRPAAGRGSDVVRVKVADFGIAKAAATAVVT